jgi:hypothetical protein
MILTSVEQETSSNVIYKNLHLMLIHFLYSLSQKDRLNFILLIEISLPSSVPSNASLLSGTFVVCP